MSDWQFAADQVTPNGTIDLQGNPVDTTYTDTQGGQPADPNILPPQPPNPFATVVVDKNGNTGPTGSTPTFGQYVQGVTGINTTGIDTSATNLTGLNLTVPGITPGTSFSDLLPSSGTVKLLLVVAGLIAVAVISRKV